MRTKLFLFLFLMMACIARGQTVSQVTGYDCRLIVDGQVLKQRALSPAGGKVTWNADMLDLPIGLHHVTAQVLRHETEGASTMQFESFFYRIPVNEEEITHHIEATCYIDDNLYEQTTMSTTGGFINWNLDVSALPVGLHTMKVLIVDCYGSMTSTDCYQSFFYRIATEEGITHQVNADIYIDGELFQQESLQVDGGMSEWMLDVNELPDGLHDIKVLLTDETNHGTSTARYDSFFYRVPTLDDNVGIIGYDYWVNQEYQGHVDVSPRQVVYLMDTLLTVPEQEIRSTSFHFAVEDDVPVIYAQNYLWVMFHDVSGKNANAWKAFTDIRTRREVTGITLLSPGETAAMNRPAENEIKWYKVEALAGDTVLFKTDKACTWQLFSPTGEELYSAEGNPAKEWGGVRTSEDGTYYVAVHDMTVSGSTLNISYKHVDGQFELTVNDWEILKSFYTKYGNGNFTWNLSNRFNIRNVEGVNIAMGHVVSIELPGKGLQGGFPSMLLGLEQLRVLDLSHNGLNGAIADQIAQYLAQLDTLNTSVQVLNLAFNDFTGNVGALASHFAALTTLDVSGNRFNEISPAVASRVALNINDQRLAAVNGDLSQGMDAVYASIPAICYYHHPSQGQSSSLRAQLTDSTQSPLWKLFVTPNNGNYTLSASGDYYGANGQDIDIFTTVTGNSWTNHQSLDAIFSFAQGDANLSGNVDVTDLQAIINRIFNSYNNPFNYTASNLHVDNVLNVQDIVGEVNVLLAQAPGRSPRRVAGQEDQSPLASLYWSDGVLYLNSPVPVAAIDIVSNVDRAIRWKVDDLGMIVSTTRNEQGEHTVIYSLGDALIPAGIIPIATTTSQWQAIVAAKLSDADAQEIPVSFADAPSGLNEIISNKVSCQWENGRLNIISGEPFSNVDVTIYGIDGRVIYETHLPQLENGRTAIDVQSMIERNSYYFIVIRSSGQMIARQKITLIH